MRFVKESAIRASPERVFEFHERPDVLSLLIPPWENARVVHPTRISEVGTQAIVEVKVFGPVTVRWIAEHTVYDPPHLFEDVQIKGPFRKWRHRHIVKPDTNGAILRDEIDYVPPLGFFGCAVASRFIQQRLQKLFDYRHEVTRRWCEGKNTG
jgi:ligand-binding SRPBCC domain-containing protein